jgi:hypothetical protein
MVTLMSTRRDAVEMHGRISSAHHAANQMPVWERHGSQANSAQTCITCPLDITFSAKPCLSWFSGKIP